MIRTFYLCPKCEVIRTYSSLRFHTAHAHSLILPSSAYRSLPKVKVKVSRRIKFSSLRKEFIMVNFK